MNRQQIIFVSLTLILAVALVAAGYATGRGPLGVISFGISRLTSGRQMIPSQTLVEENKAPAAPELAAGQWINSEPLALAKLRGRVVLIEFWPFGCYNCRNTLPTIKSQSCFAFHSAAPGERQANGSFRWHARRYRG